MLRIVFLFVFVRGLFSPSISLNCTLPSRYREDCGHYGILKEECMRKGCCWVPCTEGRGPWCFYPKDIRSPRWSFDYIGNDLEYQDDYIRLRASWKEYGVDVARLIVKDGGDAKENLLWGEFYEEKEEKTGSSIMKIDFIKERPCFKVKTEDRELFQVDDLIWKAHFITLQITLPSNSSLYGLGYQADYSLKRKAGRWPLYARDMSTVPGTNLYSAHPFLISCLSSTTNCFGLLLMNTHPIEVDYDGNGVVRFVLGGGELDLLVFSGPTMENVVQQLTWIVGRPAMQQERTLGFHQCRFGYQSVEEVEHMIRGYEHLGIPLDGVWLDIDHMDGYQDFTLDPLNYPPHKVRHLVEREHAKGRMVVPIIDPGIKVNASLRSFVDGLEMNIFLKDPFGKAYKGEVWPGIVQFIDFFHPNAGHYIGKQLEEFSFDFDGLWIDMNEPSNFLSGYTDRGIGIPRKEFYSLNYPPYDICNAVLGDVEPVMPLFSRTVPMDVLHHFKQRHLTSYSVHNIYGFQEAKLVYSVLKGRKVKRPFILSRSTFPGSGKYAITWLGDNFSTWEQMRLSITGVLLHQLVGISMVGPDLGGFIGNVEEELLARWMALGAFMPFARNHNAKGFDSQEAFKSPLVAIVTKKFFNLRYMMLPFWYTLLYKAHKYGDMVLHPTDPANDDGVFMIGRDILIAPITESGRTRKTVLLPSSGWYHPDFKTLFNNYTFFNDTVAQVEAELDQILMFIKQGTILMLYDNVKESTISTRNASDYILWIFGDEASGQVYLDDGLTGESSCFITFTFKKGQLSMAGRFGYQTTKMIRKVILVRPESTVHKTITIPLLGPSKVDLGAT